MESVAAGVERENLTAPDRFVAPVTGAVERDPDDGFAQAPVLGQQRHHMGVVVLDQIQRAFVRVTLGPASGVIPRMQVGGQAHWPAADFAELAHRPLEGAQRLPGGHVADVAGQVGPVAVGEAEGVLQLPAHGQHGGSFEAQVDRQRRVAARPADR